MIACKICGKEMKAITNSHLARHGVSVEDYMREHGPIASEEFKTAASERIKAMNIARRGVSRSEEVKQKISAKNKGRVPPNKGRSMTEEQKDKLSAKMSGRYASGELVHWHTGGVNSEETRAKIAAANTGNKLSEEHREKLRAAISRRKERGEYVAPMAGKTLSDDHKKKLADAMRVNNHMTVKKMENLRRVCEENDLDIVAVDGPWVNLTCRVCSEQFRFSAQMFNASSDRLSDYCPRCHPREQCTSKGEKSLVDFIRSSYNGRIVENDRQVLGGKEIDVLIPDLNLGIEYTGLYWHAEKQNPEKKHLLWKKQFAHKQGVRLVTIFEDEWLNRREIVESRIVGMLGLHTTKVNARDTTVGKLLPREKNDFFDRCHLQGHDVSHVAFGLFHEDGKLVAAMSFKRTNMSKGGDGSAWEISRFCTELGMRVVGGAGKLLAHFRKEFDDGSPIISYADSRWSDGGLYKSLGFEFVEATPPSYWYMECYKIRKHRSTMMKHRLLSEFDADPSMTEWEIAQSLGYDRIWDCGTTKWILE